MTLVIAQEDTVNEMWIEYLRNIDEYDHRLASGWNADATGVIIFVSLHIFWPHCPSQ